MELLVQVFRGCKGIMSHHHEDYSVIFFRIENSQKIGIMPVKVNKSLNFDVMKKF
jgi:hypothetical protein